MYLAFCFEADVHRVEPMRPLGTTVCSVPAVRFSRKYGSGLKRAALILFFLLAFPLFLSISSKHPISLIVVALPLFAFSVAWASR
jgi:hypothetical protein